MQIGERHPCSVCKNAEYSARQGRESPKPEPDDKRATQNYVHHDVTIDLCTGNVPG
jgi:hypothetical protein